MKRILCHSVLLLFVCTSAHGLTIDLGSSNFGNLSQLDIGDNVNADGIDMDCGPTAAVNSLAYLQATFAYFNTHQPVADNNPTNGEIDYTELSAAGEQMAIDMGTGSGGTTTGGFGSGLNAYLSANDITDYTATIYGHVSAAFLGDSLGDRAALNILLQEGAAHFLTVYSLDWNYETDWAGMGDIGFIDPWSGGSGLFDIWMDGGTMWTNYSFTGEPSRIAWAMSILPTDTTFVGDTNGPGEHDATAPVPEPATMVLLGAGLIALAVFRKKQLKR
jgi:hypothetical protein